MTLDRDFDRRLRDWLHDEAPAQAPDRVLVTVRERVATTRRAGDRPMPAGGHWLGVAAALLVGVAGLGAVWALARPTLEPRPGPTSVAGVVGPAGSPAPTHARRTPRPERTERPTPPPKEPPPTAPSRPTATPTQADLDARKARIARAYRRLLESPVESWWSGGRVLLMDGDAASATAWPRLTDPASSGSFFFQLSADGWIEIREATTLLADPSSRLGCATDDAGEYDLRIGDIRMDLSAVDDPCPKRKALLEDAWLRRSTAPVLKANGWWAWQPWPGGPGALVVTIDPDGVRRISREGLDPVTGWAGPAVMDIGDATVRVVLPQYGWAQPCVLPQAHMEPSPWTTLGTAVDHLATAPGIDVTDTHTTWIDGVPVMKVWIRATPGGPCDGQAMRLWALPAEPSDVPETGPGAGVVWLTTIEGDAGPAIVALTVPATNPDTVEPDVLVRTAVRSLRLAADGSGSVDGPRRTPRPGSTGDPDTLPVLTARQRAQVADTFDRLLGLADGMGWIGNGRRISTSRLEQESGADVLLLTSVERGVVLSVQLSADGRLRIRELSAILDGVSRLGCTAGDAGWYRLHDDGPMGFTLIADADDCPARAAIADGSWGMDKGR